MFSRNVLPRLSYSALRARRYRPFATTTAPQTLYEYIVIINDLPTAKRPARSQVAAPKLRNLSFMGNIEGSGPEDIRGEVLACQATSKEEIETHLRSHPSAKNVWDMETISIWPLDTVHSSMLDASSDRMQASSASM